MEESRKQFEVTFAKSKSLSVSDVESVRCGDSYWDEANLKTSGISEAWHFWQASRAAIEIEAPEFIGSREALTKGFTVDYSNGFGDGMDAYEANIRAAGLRVKEK